MKATNKQEHVIMIAVVLFTLLVRGVYAFSKDSFMGGDSLYYIGQAEKILHSGFAFYRENISTPYYWGYPSFLAFLFFLFGKNYEVIVTVQLLLSTICSLLIYKTIRDLTTNVCAAVFLTCAYSCILDVILWDSYILSDSLGMTLECFSLFFFYRAYIFKSEKTYDKLFCFIFMVLFFMTRTNSISLLLVLVGMILIGLPKIKRRIVAIVMTVLIGMLIFSLLGIDKEVDFSLQWEIEKFIGYYENGIIVTGRPEYDYIVPTAHLNRPEFIMDILIMLLLKAKYYWSIYFMEYSIIHKALCCLTILPVFLFSVFSAIWIIKDKKRNYYPLLLGVISYSIIQIFTEVDFDMRYRAPIFLLLIILCGYGTVKFIDLFCKKEIK